MLSSIISSCFRNKNILFLFVFSSCFFKISQSQNSNNEFPLERQRAIMVYNLSRQVKWPNINKISTFKIGIMATDKIKNSLSKVLKNKRLFEKLIEVEKVQNLDNVKDYNVVYVNSTYEYLIKSILNRTKGKEVLIITENYPTNSSMINMVHVGNTYKYDINRQYIRESNLKITPVLTGFAVSSRKIREALYKNAEEKLDVVVRENNKQKRIIESQIDTISKKDELINSKNYSIKNLTFDSKLKAKEITEKIIIERELEKELEKQIGLIAFQQLEIDSVNKEIITQQKILEIQNKKIKEKSKILKKKNAIINTQRKNNIILSILTGLLFITCLFLLLAYVSNKKLNKRLNLKHFEIQKQSKLLTSKNKELEQFAYIASHDLQEPLNTVSSFIDIINSEYYNKFDDEGKQILGFIKEGSVRMKKLIDALLQYSRLGRTKVFEDVNCMPLLDMLIKDLESTIKKNEAEISYNDLPTIKGNDVELRLLFQNLITNGIKFRIPGVKPKINIVCEEILEIDDRSRSKEMFWKFSVTDNGIGIEKEYQDRIFDIFQRLHSRLEYEGSGIGLAHCKKIVESHSGEIWFTSKKGAGTTFSFSIPKKVYA